MKVVETVAAMEEARSRLRGVVGLVPTMGALHEGHLSLVRRAREDCDHVVASVFVNPAQFGPDEDLDSYPRDLDRDLRLLEDEGVDLVFAPSRDEMYPPGPSAGLRTGFDGWVEVSGPLISRLEGESRPQFFRGVTTVVARLFRIVRPDRAYFGEKDAQQLRVVRAMARQERLPVEVVGQPVVREPDGLAMSSRNAYLSPEERTAALAVPRALDLARRMIERDGVRDARTVREAVRELIAGEPLARLDYVAVADDETLAELETIDSASGGLVLLAVWVGSTRLIDNSRVRPVAARVSR